MISKILPLYDLLQYTSNNTNKKIVFTNGCFDILHSGHIELLSKAKSLGDILIVGLNSDYSIRQLKGSKRPINNENNRSLVLSSLYVVDYVVLFNEETPLDLINNIRPDVLVKGGDYNPEDIVGYSFVKSYNGQVITIPFNQDISTSQIINKILSLYS